jgi:crotonobetainyl-CoA:carnitine CoA-transferase CaiB-like acyl-CoA transferase
VLSWLYDHTEEDPDVTAPLSGVRVLDFTRILAGPFATMKLGDMGADVIKIERPGRGDDTRGWGPPFVDGWSTYFLSLNRNKRSMTLNLKDARSHEILERLVRSCEVVVQNFRPGTMEALGLSEARLREWRPDLVYCSVTGYGDDPAKAEASYDLIVQGESGIMDITGHDQPTKVAVSIGDLMAGQLAVEGILLALLQKSRDPSAGGQKIDISLFDALLSLLTYQGQSFLTAGQEPVRRGNAHPSLAPYESYRAVDGALNIGVGSEELWEKLCGALERPDWLKDSRFALNRDRVEHREELLAEIEGELAGGNVAHWLERLRTAGVPCGPLRGVKQALLDPRTTDRGMLWELPQPVLGTLTMVGNPVHLSQDKEAAVRAAPPPELGQHTHEILEQLGYVEAEIVRMQDSGLV